MAFTESSLLRNLACMCVVGSMPGALASWYVVALDFFRFPMISQTLSDVRRAADEERARLQSELTQLRGRHESDSGLLRKQLEDAVRLQLNQRILGGVGGGTRLLPARHSFRLTPSLTPTILCTPDARPRRSTTAVSRFGGREGVGLRQRPALQSDRAGRKPQVTGVHPVGAGQVCCLLLFCIGITG